MATSHEHSSQHLAPSAIVDLSPEESLALIQRAAARGAKGLPVRAKEESKAAINDSKLIAISSQAAMPAASKLSDTSPKAFDPKAFLKTVPNLPGSYRMYDKKSEVIYVGKAKDLKKRLSSYFLKNRDPKTQALVSHIAHIEYTVTFSETEALILENELIKKYQPRYNILLRDDKSYPFILLTTKDKHPGIFLHRGAHTKKGEYFGPFPDSNAVRDSLKLLQKIFPIRQCENTVYAHRSRPCLIAQMKKCLAPCVAMSEEQSQHYAEQVELVRLFLQGKNQELLQELSARMEQHAERLEFEQAAQLRDQLKALRHIQESNSIVSGQRYDLDVVGYAMQGSNCCIHVLFIREGRILGSRSFFPKYSSLVSPEELIYSFLSQFYLNDEHLKFIPKEVLVASSAQAAPEMLEFLKLHKAQEVAGDFIAVEGQEAEAETESIESIASQDVSTAAHVAQEHAAQESNLEEPANSQAEPVQAETEDSTSSEDNVDSDNAASVSAELDFSALEQALKQQLHTTVKFKLATNLRKSRAQFVQLALTNARVALENKLSTQAKASLRIEALELLLKRKGIEHMECYDISHTMGECTVASCVSFNREGPESNRYRRYNIEGITKGDDFAAMQQVLTRRFRDPSAAELPDIVFIDGGLGQLSAAESIIDRSFANTGLEPPLLLSVAKGEGRKEGLETIIVGYTHEKLNLSLHHPALQLILHIRNEAHRFAITGHRARLAKARRTSKLESLEGVGPLRRKALLQHLGGLQEVMSASVTELQKVPGISAKLASKIYAQLHGSSTSWGKE